ncbi:MAG TPA: adenylate/guanylate cyclase domain-containing protein [Propionibacteriaceae bacterium]|nr:adenylate/guanylate cyclase domain-containing protein [Propionibacteriaceae bacterium]
MRRARGDPDADDMLGFQTAIVHHQVAAFGGRVHKSLGDGFLITFPSAVAAVSAAAAIQRGLHQHNAANPQRAVEIRIGIHTGKVAEHDGDLHAQAVHAAARVMAGAPGGQILTSNEVRKLAEPQVEWSFLDSGLFWLRGFPERWRLYEVSWGGTFAARPSVMPARLTPFVERDAERATLRLLIDVQRQARSDGLNRG